jgi:phosphatidylserine decarboxylase
VKVAPEGRPFIAAGVVGLLGFALGGLALGGWWWIPAGVWLPVALWVPFFFRDPDPGGKRGPHLILAPASGRIVSVGRVDEPEFVRGAAQRVSIFMNVFDVHVNRVPASGVTEHRDYRPGKFFNATLDKASEHNERLSVGIRTPAGPMLVRQIAGLIARRIVCDPRPGDRVVQGERLGLIRFGSRVDTFLPSTVQLRVVVGDRTVAGRTVIAEWSTGGRA